MRIVLCCAVLTGIALIEVNDFVTAELKVPLNTNLSAPDRH